jgi:hypothetical protein
MGKIPIRNCAATDPYRIKKDHFNNMGNQRDQMTAEDAQDPARFASPGAAVLEQVAGAMQPLVQLLLAHGVTYPQLADTLKGVFVDAAERNAAVDCVRVTDSKIAITTGIHRKDVKRLREAGTCADKATPDAVSPGTTSVVITRWLADKAYADANGRPQALTRNGASERSFDALVKSVSKDVHPRTILDELLRLDLVTLHNECVQLKVDSFVPKPDFIQMLGFLGANLHDHAAAATHNTLGKLPPFLEQSVYSDTVDAAAIAELATLARQQWAHVLKEVVPEVARHEITTPASSVESVQNKTPIARLRLGMYFYAEDRDQ